MSLSHLIRILFSLFFALLLTACMDDEPVSQEENSAKTSLEDAEMMLSAAGVGPINAQTPFNIHQLTIAFQNHDYHVEQRQTRTGSGDYPVIRISKDADTLLLINPTLDQKSIFSVLVKDKRIGNTLGHALGSEFGSIYEYGHVEQCTAGVEAMSGAVLCYAPKSDNVLYMFSDENTNNFPDNKLPPVDALDSWKLTAIIWKPTAKKAD